MLEGKMTIAQIAQRLRTENIDDSFVAYLSADDRVGVQKLLHSWQRQQRADAAERIRLEALFRYERQFTADGYRYIAGIDEAGRGPLAGPVVIGAVILPLDCFIPKLNDSKKLSAQQREKLYEAIKEQAISAEYVIIDADVIDELNILQATIKGMYQAIELLAPQPQAVLIDAVPLPELAQQSLSLIGGDGLSASIAAASIVAKVTRDHLMLKYDEQYPEYGFKHHKGYGTAEHLTAIRKYGPCPLHRHSFEPIKSMGVV